MGDFEDRLEALGQRNDELEAYTQRLEKRIEALENRSEIRAESFVLQNAEGKPTGHFFTRSLTTIVRQLV